MDVCVIDHPLARARLTTLRDERTDNAAFRAALRDLTHMLVYEATRDAVCAEISVRTPIAETVGSRLAAPPPLLVPVLRAGLGMVDQAHALIPPRRRSASSAWRATRPPISPRPIWSPCPTTSAPSR